ncbi:MAG: M20/M25/M40 family metallo-hydrolase [Gemmatimonadales bacterium]|nr:M20/M25/M40 family metallo-hydrolase [Gemmatimonadales bacterium]
MSRLALGTAALLAGFPATAAAQSPDWHARTRTMFEHVINIPTVVGRGRVPELAQYLAGEFRAAGWSDGDIHVLPYDSTVALIVRWPAAARATRKPIMLMGHMDVVEAKREDSSTDPFVMVERDGYYYGRGTTDMKDGVVGITQALIRLRSEGFKPRRDIVVFFTGDEEIGSRGSELGATEWKKYLDVEYGLNADVGGGFTRNGRALGFTIQTAEKLYMNYTFAVRNRGGHSSKPRADNAIYQLSAALTRLGAHRFQPTLTETTRAYFAGREKSEPGALGDAMRAWLRNPSDSAAADAIEADEREAGITRTRCVATRLFGGHADNALPQLATANVNCRIMPGVDPKAILDELRRTVSDTLVVITPGSNRGGSPPSPLRADVVGAYTRAVHALHPGVPVFPEMSTGATDAIFFRSAGIPVYGTNGTWLVVPEDLRKHGRDERIPVKALDDNVAHWMMLVRDLTK